MPGSFGERSNIWNFITVRWRARYGKLALYWHRLPMHFRQNGKLHDGKLFTPAFAYP